MSTKSKKDDIHLNGRACLELELHSPESVPLPPASSSQGQSPCPSTSSEPPDGGSKAWLAVFGAWCCLFCSFGWVNCIGLFQAQYEKHQLSSYTHSTVAWITSVETSSTYLCMPVNGKLYDAYGPGPLLMVGSLLHVFGLMMASVSTQYYQILLSQSICSAMGASAIFAAATGPVGTWFLRRRALAFGIVASGSSLSGCILPIMVTRIGPILGFPWAMRLCAFMFLLLLIMGNLTLRSRVPPASPRKPWHVREFMTPLVHEPAFALNAAGLALFSGGMFVVFGFLVLEAQHRGMSADLANYTISILSAVSILGRIIPGWLGDRVGTFNVMIATTGLSSLLVLAIWIPAPEGSSAATMAFACMFGFTSGTFAGTTPALVRQISSVETAGVRLGTTFGVISIAVLASNPIAGALISSNSGGYLYLKIFCGAVMAAACGLLTLSRAAQCGWKWQRI